MLPLILATPALYTPFPPHCRSTGIFRRIKSDTSSGQRNLPVLLRFRRVIFTAETRWIHRHKGSRGGPLNFNPSHPIPLPTGMGGFMKKHPGCTVSRAQLDDNFESDCYELKINPIALRMEFWPF